MGTCLTNIIFAYMDFKQISNLEKDVRIWDCLRGDPKKITITIEHYSLADIADIETWLNNRWLEKDRILMGE